MVIKFHTGLKEINISEKPIAKAWELSASHLNLDKKLNKLMEILEDHENLFISYNPYHNHNHLAEVVWASAYIIKNEKIESKVFESMVILLLAATFHDAGHTGKANREPFEMEKKSASFFKDWWKNNSLFVENILDLPPIHIEQAVTELILFTDFSQGQQKAACDYITRKENETFGLKLCKLKKVLNEADFLLNCLPHTGYEKTGLIIKESVRNTTEEQKWLLLLDFLQNYTIDMFITDGSRELKIDAIIKKFTNFLIANKQNMKNSQKILEDIELKFKTF